MTFVLVPYAVRSAGEWDAGRMCPDDGCDLFYRETTGPGSERCLCLAEDSGIGCPRMRSPPGTALLTGETRAEPR